ncbi:MmgE/PrpD family protein [Pseudaestuariivita atlantica]|uniref:2-methylcitrate dehydratase n=1 Tax=Pseudaestuariivita atlantica TaxID=1317121 RepID=A0A0L1JMR7_9RHOB|nr:MmgE/PrpD family protein [Pseudaestuariivita atlantica]KNG93044.1 2-methylcitrate dehydratase [Pseudaestuariivita atlantica]
MTGGDAGDATRLLARFVANQSGRDIPHAVRAVFQLSLQDWVSVALAGTDEPVSRRVRAMVVEEGGAPQAQVIHGPRLPARAAALANGTISHALDYDDTHFDHIGHPSVAVIPAALAMAQRSAVSGHAFQEAALVGMEASIAVGLWLGRAHYQVGFHQTATAGAFGAAAAAGRLLKFDADQMACCFGLVATRASGLKSQFGTMGKPLNAGNAASNGVEAALLVAHGLQPDPAGLDGPLGFGATHHGAADMTAFDGLGTDWRLPRVQHKFHACCHGLHATLEALAELPNPDPSEVARIDIAVHPRWLSVCAKPAPRTGLELKFSYAGVTALALLGHGTARLDTFSTAMAQDPRVMAFYDRVHVTADDTLTEMQARVILTRQGGTQETAFGDLEKPMTLAQRTRRIQSKSASLIGTDKSNTLRRRVVAAVSPTQFATLLTKGENGDGKAA